MEFFNFDISAHKSKELHINRNDILYQAGETPEYVYFIKSGLIGLFHISENGKETFLRIFGANSILGHRSFFAGEKYHANAVALESTEILAVSRQECELQCQNDSNILKNILKKVAHDLREAELRLAGLHDKTTNTRIAESLVFMKLKYPERTWTRKEIAEYSCTSAESVARLMTKLQEQEIIKKEGRDFHILNQEKLIHLPADLS